MPPSTEGSHTVGALEGRVSDSVDIHSPNAVVKLTLDIVSHIRSFHPPSSKNGNQYQAGEVTLMVV